MSSLKILESYGFLPYLRNDGKLKPHLSLKFEGATFHVDTLKGDGYNLITHAHSDHYGQRNMKNKRAIASIETAKILEAVTKKSFSGITFSVGETLNLDENIKIKTYDTKHMDGSSAFLLSNSDCRILITGDVKDWKIPKCDVLITEATYGNPEYVFEDEVDRIIKEALNSTYGVYPIGKAQRVARILIENGYNVNSEQSISKICNALDIPLVEDADVKLVTTRNIWKARGKKYIITAQRFYKLPRIVLSDHLDYKGLLNMVEYSGAECVIFYHGKPSKKLITDVKEMGKEVYTLKDLDSLSIY